MRQPFLHPRHGNSNTNKVQHALNPRIYLSINHLTPPPLPPPAPPPTSSPLFPRTTGYSRFKHSLPCVPQLLTRSPRSRVLQLLLHPLSHTCNLASHRIQQHKRLRRRSSSPRATTLLIHYVHRPRGRGTWCFVFWMQGERGRAFSEPEYSACVGGDTAYCIAVLLC